MDKYESSVIKGLEFTTEEKQKEFDRLLLSKDDINRFIVEYNLSSIEEEEKWEKFLSTVYENGKLIVRLIKPEQMKVDNVDNALIMAFPYFYQSMIKDYFGEDIIKEALNDSLKHIDYYNSIRNIAFILSGNIDKSFVFEKIYQELKSRLVLE